jgi:hypothetical protein
MRKRDELLSANGRCQVAGQMIMNLAVRANNTSLTCANGRDGGIRTRGLLLPKQAR